MSKWFSLRTLVLTFTCLLLGSAVLLAQRPTGGRPGPQKRISPHETISRVIGKGRNGNRVTITYGRPYSKDSRSGEVRKIWGGLVPYGKVWRAGADEATTLITQQPLVIGETNIPAGAYTVFMLPEESGASKLIINKQLGQWGLQYDEKQDFARVDLKKEALDQDVDQFTMAVDNNPTSGTGTIRLVWEKTEFSLDFAVKP